LGTLIILLRDIDKPGYGAKHITEYYSKHWPYELTVDVMFDSPSVYQLVKASELLRPNLISSLSNIPVSEVIHCGFFEVALVFQSYYSKKKKWEGGSVWWIYGE
jgi:hypothetical protein